MADIFFFLRNSRDAQRFVGFFIVLFGCWLAGQTRSDHMISLMPNVVLSPFLEVFGQFYHQMNSPLYFLTPYHLYQFCLFVIFHLYCYAVHHWMFDSFFSPQVKFNGLTGTVKFNTSGNREGAVFNLNNILFKEVKTVRIVIIFVSWFLGFHVGLMMNL